MEAFPSWALDSETRPTDRSRSKSLRNICNDTVKPDLYLLKKPLPAHLIQDLSHYIVGRSVNLLPKLQISQGLSAFIE